jgi:hypothetical protein
LHDSLAEIAAGAIEAGRHVWWRKPAARRAAEIAHFIWRAPLQKKVPRRASVSIIAIIAHYVRRANWWTVGKLAI